jgi:hypothetical protein
MEEKRKYKYYQIHFWFLPEVYEKLEDLSHYYVREYLKELFNNNDVREFLSIPRIELEEFFSKGHITKQIYVNKEQHEKWKALPRGIKQRLYYLINKKLLEVLKNELQIHSTKD